MWASAATRAGAAQAVLHRSADRAGQPPGVDARAAGPPPAPRPAGQPAGDRAARSRQINDIRGRETGDAVLTEVGRRIRSCWARRTCPPGWPATRSPCSPGRRGAGLRVRHPDRGGAGRADRAARPSRRAAHSPPIGWPSWRRRRARRGATARRRGPQRAQPARPGPGRAYDKTSRWSSPADGARTGAAGVVAGASWTWSTSPWLDLADSQPVGVEALLRWRHPRLGASCPPSSCRSRGRSGIAAEMGMGAHRPAAADGWRRDAAFWAVGQRLARAARRRRFPPVAATLNRISCRPSGGGRGRRGRTCRGHAGDVASLAGLRNLGVRAALDDFGAGQARSPTCAGFRSTYSSWTGAGQQPAGRPGPARRSRRGGEPGRRLGIQIVAKGLETPEQIARAAKAGCLYGQGFELGRPPRPSASRRTWKVTGPELPGTGEPPGPSCRDRKVNRA